MNFSIKIYRFFLLLIYFFIAPCEAQENLMIKTNGQKRIYTQEILLNDPNLVLLKSVSLPSYPNQVFDLKAIPLCKILHNEEKAHPILKMQSWDKYLLYLPLDEIYPCDPKRKSIPYLAIEDPQKPWPIVEKIRRSPGPFYLVWQGEKVHQTNWIFGLISINTTPKNPFFSLLPANSNAIETKGLVQFATKCGLCHSINLVGNQEVGPDLNYPMNPTEYFSEEILRKFIRNNQSVRLMKNDKMIPFPEQLLSNEELDSLIAFLKLMRKHKIPSLQQASTAKALPH